MISLPYVRRGSDFSMNCVTLLASRKTSSRRFVNGIDVLTHRSRRGPAHSTTKNTTLTKPKSISLTSSGARLLRMSQVWRREANRLLGAHPSKREIGIPKVVLLCSHPCERKAASARADGVAANNRRLDGQRHRPGRTRGNAGDRRNLTGKHVGHSCDLHMLLRGDNLRHATGEPEDNNSTYAILASCPTTSRVSRPLATTRCRNRRSGAWRTPVLAAACAHGD
jgi:hypothetical protein